MKKIRLVWLFVAAVLSLAGTQVWADDQAAPDATPVTDVDALNNRLTALEKSSASGLKVNGWLQLWYTQDSYGANTPANSSDYNSSKNQWSAFSVKRSEIVFTGGIGDDPKASFKLSVDPSQSSFNGLGGVAGSTLVYGGNNTSTTTAINPFTLVKDLYSQIAYSPAFTLVIGQNKLWDALEGRIPSKDLDFNNYSNVDGNAFGNKRDIGVQLTGSGIATGDFQFEYDLALLDGAGQSAFDNDVDKDLAGRVGVTYDKSFFLGASAYDGWEPNGVRQYVGFESRWISGGFKAQAEFLTGSLNTLDNNSANDSTWTPSIGFSPKGYATPTGQITPAGYYLQASYRLGDWRLGGRWDGYNFNQQNNVSAAGGNQEWDVYTFGLDWFQAKDSYKLSLNWEDHLLNGVDTYNVWTIQSQISI